MLSQRERLRCSRACFTSPSTSQETGATFLYHGQVVFSEWQLMQAWANTSVTDWGTSDPSSSGAPARSDAVCGTGCTSTEASSHTTRKPETASPAFARRLKRSCLGRVGFLTVLFTPCKTCKVAGVFPALMPPEGSRQVKKFRVVQIGYYPVRHLRAVPVEDLIALRVLLLYRAVGRAMIRPYEHVNVMHATLVNERRHRPT